ncbi:hypothetical protein [uncultured Corynebacterium sp.]|uniref:hypothetical protein n=1 Tax=uncultured Corynebacterium sp. TaxID=159447 RepID=UPI002609EDDA|nr:hypothetical protein [uncultured Corynebacterium sp.]
METQSLIIIAIVVAVVAIAGFFIFRIFIGGQKAADNEVGRHQQDIDDQKQVNRLKSEERVRDDRVHGDGVRDDRTAGDRVHDDRTAGNRSADPRGATDPRGGHVDSDSPIRDEHRDNRHNSPMRDNVLSTDRDVLRDQPDDVGPDRRP